MHDALKWMSIILEALPAIAEEILILYRAQESQLLYLKEDASPLTSADLLAHQKISEVLQKLEPSLPILSEESAIPPFEIRKQWQHYWLLDPLDGTREFLEKTNDFSINIGLISKSKPVFGIVYLPVYQRVYFASLGYGAWKKEGNEAPQRIFCRSATPPLTALVSRFHSTKEKEFLENKIAVKEWIAYGSSYKLCLIAEGKADIYPRLSTTMEWDTAAAHCILREASGELLNLKGQPLLYNTFDNLKNPPFVAVGDVEFWLARVNA